MAAFVEALVSVDFGLPCSAARSFCGICEAPACLHCCPEHAVAHHPTVGDGIRRTIEVVLLENQFPAVSVSTIRTRGLGYSWNFIQRVEHEGSSWVMLSRDQPRRRGWYRGNCISCRCAINARSQYCCTACKIAAVRQGQSWEVVRRLVTCDFTRRHLFDRFCTACELAFSSEFCSYHSLHHGPGEQAPVLNIVREDGWVLIPEHQLPAALTDGIKRVQLNNGTLAVPIRPRLLPNPHGGPNLCSAPGCEEALDGAEVVCSIECKNNL